MLEGEICDEDVSVCSPAAHRKFGTCRLPDITIEPIAARGHLRRSRQQAAQDRLFLRMPGTLSVVGQGAAEELSARRAHGGLISGGDAERAVPLGRDGEQPADRMMVPLAGIQVFEPTL